MMESRPPGPVELVEFLAHDDEYARELEALGVEPEEELRTNLEECEELLEGIEELTEMYEPGE